MGQSGPPEPKDESPTGNCRRTLYGLLTGLVGAIALGLRLLAPIEISSTGAGRICATALAAAGIFVGGRLVVHLKIGYWQWQGEPDSSWTPWHRRVLSLMTVVEGTLSVALAFNGAYFFFHPNRWLQLGVSLALTLAVVLLAHIVREVIRNDGPPRGADVMEGFLLVRVARDIAETLEDFWFVRDLDRLVWEPRSSAHQLSGLIGCVIVCLVITTGAQALAVAPEVVHYLGRDEQHNGAGKAKGEGSSPEANAGGSAATGVKEETERTGTPPTYEELCGGPVDVGRKAPESEAIGLELAWEAVGGVNAACAKKARPVPNVSGAYFVPGFCVGEFRSLAVVSEHPAAVLLEQPARFARKLVIEGRLSGASDRLPLGEGDFQLIFTVDGPYLAIRRDKTDGDGGVRRKPWRCTELRPARSRYTIMPPGLTGLWLRLAMLGHRTWPTGEGPQDDGEDRFAFRDETGLTVALGFCSAPTDCRLDFQWEWWNSDEVPLPNVTTRTVREFGPTF